MQKYVVQHLQSKQGQTAPVPPPLLEMWFYAERAKCNKGQTQWSRLVKEYVQLKHWSDHQIDCLQRLNCVGQGSQTLFGRNEQNFTHNWWYGLSRTSVQNCTFIQAENEEHSKTVANFMFNEFFFSNILLVTLMHRFQFNPINLVILNVPVCRSAIAQII